MTWYSIIHGPEAWLAIAIWGAGAMFGVAASWAAIEISDRREETREHDKSDLDHPGKRGGGPPAGRGSQGERGG